MKTSALAFMLTLAVWLPAEWQQGKETPSLAAPTFSESIAPILYSNCVSCHRPGEAAPFPLISYEDVVKRGALVAKVTQSRYMPPWRAAHGYGEFKDERRLTDAQIESIGAWVRAGMPRGDRAKMPAPPQFTDGWQLGKPDLILEMAESYDVPADGPDIYRNFIVPTGLTEDKWVRAVEFRPSARKAVHHALISYVRGDSAAKLDARSEEPGFGGAMLVSLVPGGQFQPAGQLGGWAVGTTPRFFPGGFSRPMAKGSDLILQLHFHPTGRPEVERSLVGLYFADTPAERRLFTPGIPGLFGLLANIDIPAGEKAYTINGSFTTPVDMRALSVTAHAHYLGKEFKVTATLPDGSTKPMLWIQDWDFNWQDRYDYEEPVLLPKDTRVDVAITYDNSAANPRNPCNPPRRVTWGVQSLDEMGSVNFVMVAVNKEDEDALQQKLAAMVKTTLAELGRSGAVKRYFSQQQRFMDGTERRPADGCGEGPR